MDEELNCGEAWIVTLFGEQPEKTTIPRTNKQGMNARE